MIETMVVGWDETKSSQAALEWALKRPQEAKFVLVHVTDVDDSKIAASARTSPAAAVHAALRDEVARVRATHPHVSVSSEFVHGDTSEELARFSNDKALVVVGTDRQRGGGIRYAWSVGAKLAATSRGPIAIIPMSKDVEVGEIVVGVDGSAASNAALEFAASEADRTGSALLAVLAWQEPPVLVDATVPDPDYLRSLEEMYGHVLDYFLAAAAEKHPRLHVHRSLVRGAAAEALLDASTDARLLVVGNPGLRGIGRFLLGSVSRSIVANTQCPVVFVHGDSER